MSVSGTNYVVISPVRDEEAYIRFTVDCMARQTIVPKEWVLINDGSSDKTGEILDEYAQRYPWIRVVHRANRGFRKAGGGVVEAFNAGYNALEFRDWDFLVKLDGDLSFEPDYFEKCFQNFEKEPRLGVGGGVICYVTNGVKEFEPSPVFHVRGATKIYKRGCWDAIGGFWPAPGWDTMDEVKANMLGWSTRSFLDLHIVHHRKTGTADGEWAGLGQERQGKLHLRLSSALHDHQVHRKTRKKTISHWCDWLCSTDFSADIGNGFPKSMTSRRSAISGASNSGGFWGWRRFGGERVEAVQFFWTIQHLFQNRKPVL